MNHRGFISILEDMDAALPTHIVPRHGAWHSLCLHHGYRVVGCCCRSSSHTHTLQGRAVVCRQVRQQFDEVGIVDHCIVDQQRLLSVSELVVRTHAPLVAFEPFVKRIIIGHEERFRTCSAEGFAEPHVIDQVKHDGVVAVFLQSLIDGVTQP